MGHFNLMLHRDCVWEVLNELGKHGYVEFEDLNANNQ
jgi:hypothetical protein